MFSFREISVTSDLKIIFSRVSRSIYSASSRTRTSAVRPVWLGTVWQNEASRESLERSGDLGQLPLTKRSFRPPAPKSFPVNKPYPNFRNDRFGHEKANPSPDRKRPRCSNQIRHLRRHHFAPRGVARLQLPQNLAGRDVQLRLVELADRFDRAVLAEILVELLLALRHRDRVRRRDRSARGGILRRIDQQLERRPGTMRPPPAKLRREGPRNTSRRRVRSASARPSPSRSSSWWTFAGSR